MKIFKLKPLQNKLLVKTNRCHVQRKIHITCNIPHYPRIVISESWSKFMAAMFFCYTYESIILRNSQTRWQKRLILIYFKFLRKGKIFSQKFRCDGLDSDKG